MKPIEKKCFLCPQNKFGKCLLYCVCNGTEFTQSHRPEEVIPNSYDKCKPGLKKKRELKTVFNLVLGNKVATVKMCLYKNHTRRFQ